MGVLRELIRDQHINTRRYLRVRKYIYSICFSPYRDYRFLQVERYKEFFCENKVHNHQG